MANKNSNKLHNLYLLENAHYIRGKRKFIYSQIPTYFAERAGETKYEMYCEHQIGGRFYFEQSDRAFKPKQVGLETSWKRTVNKNVKAFKTIYKLQ